MPYDPMTTTIAADDAEALGLLLFEASTHLRPKTPATERLTEKLFAARIAEAVPADIVRLGAAVTYTELGSGVQRTVRVVAPAQADAGAGRISVLSPIGCVLIGHRPGAVLDVELPMATRMQVRLDAVDHAAREPAEASAG